MENNIKRIRQEKGLSQQDLAERMGNTWQTVSNAERGIGSLSMKKLEAYAAALGVEPHELVSAADGMRRVRVAGQVQAGYFAETWQYDEGDQYDVPMPDDPRLRNKKLHAAEVRGQSMNRRYTEGTVLIYTDTLESGEALTPGKRYIVERERVAGLREATVKLLRGDQDHKYWLLPESDDPRFQEPIPLVGGEDDTIRIIGRVRYAVSRED